MTRSEGDDYELLDAGIGRRLERFGSRVVDRPAPTAAGWRSTPEAWARADLRFDAGGGWEGSPTALEPWRVGVADGITMELRPTTSGGLGLYPEHLKNLPWIADQVAWTSSLLAGAAGARGAGEVAGGVEAAGEAAVPHVLNLFAHTGLATLAAARAGAAVTHVDAARGAVAWARHNAALSGLDDRPIRWIVDDAAAFVAREARRGRRYDGIVLDPPSFGRLKEGRRSRTWRLEDELPSLLRTCRDVATNDAWVLLTAHTEGLDGPALEALLRAAFPAAPNRVLTTSLGFESSSGLRLPLGWAVRLEL